MSALLSDLRGIGLPMDGRYAPTSFTDPETKEDHVSQLHVGYTTDPEKAEKAGKLGATVARCGGRPVTDPYDAEQDARSEGRYEQTTTDDASERIERDRWGLGGAESPREGTEA